MVFLVGRSVAMVDAKDVEVKDMAEREHMFENVEDKVLWLGSSCKHFHQTASSADEQWKQPTAPSALEVSYPQQVSPAYPMYYSQEHSDVSWPLQPTPSPRNSQQNETFWVCNSLRDDIGTTVYDIGRRWSHYIYY